MAKYTPTQLIDKILADMPEDSIQGFMVVAIGGKIEDTELRDLSYGICGDPIVMQAAASIIRSADPKIADIVNMHKPAPGVH